MIRKFCIWLSKYLPHFTIPDSDGNPYLTRYYLFGKDRAFGNIFLHHFHQDDKDMGTDGEKLLHNHPWPFSFSIILAGGYSEERLQPDGTIRRKDYPAGSFNYMNDKHFHRVDLLEEDGWSLFFTGWRSEKRSWGFWDRVTKEYTDFTKYSKAIP